MSSPHFSSFRCLFCMQAMLVSFLLLFRFAVPPKEKSTKTGFILPKPRQADPQILERQIAAKEEKA